MFNEICINEEMLPKYTYIYIYIYIYIYMDKVETKSTAFGNGQFLTNTIIKTSGFLLEEIKLSENNKLSIIK